MSFWRNGSRYLKLIILFKYYPRSCYDILTYDRGYLLDYIVINYILR